MTQAIFASAPSRIQPDPLEGEVVSPRIADVEALARWLDYVFVLPGGFRFGLAGIFGFVPGLGDLVDALVSVYIVHRAIELGIPRLAVARMVLNVGIEGVLGAVPFIGDLFDVVFKANRRNYLLLKSHIVQSGRQRRLDALFVLTTALLVTASIALPLWVLFIILHHVG